MKTNQIVVRDGVVKQRTKDGYFSANSIIDHWNANNPNKQRSLDFYKRQKSVKELTEYLASTENIDKAMEASKGRKSETWMHPILFVDFAMYISLELKVQALKWVLDGLIKSRHDAGDYYKEMGIAILEEYINVNNKKPSPFTYIIEAKMLREIVGIDKDRNELSEKELNILTSLQKINTTLIRNHVGKESRKKQLLLIAESLKL